MTIITQRQQHRLDACPRKYRRGLEAAFSGKAGPKSSIKAMCLECMGYDTPEIARCTSTACPLWHHRPYKKS